MAIFQDRLAVEDIKSELDRIEEVVLKGDYSDNASFWKIVTKVKKRAGADFQVCRADRKD